MHGPLRLLQVSTLDGRMGNIVDRIAPSKIDISLQALQSTMLPRESTASWKAQTLYSQNPRDLQCTVGQCTQCCCKPLRALDVRYSLGSLEHVLPYSLCMGTSILLTLDTWICRWDWHAWQLLIALVPSFCESSLPCAPSFLSSAVSHSIGAQQHHHIETCGHMLVASLMKAC